MGQGWSRALRMESSNEGEIRTMVGSARSKLGPPLYPGALAPSNAARLMGLGAPTAGKARRQSKPLKQQLKSLQCQRCSQNPKMQQENTPDKDYSRPDMRRSPRRRQREEKHASPRTRRGDSNAPHQRPPIAVSSAAVLVRILPLHAAIRRHQPNFGEACLAFVWSEPYFCVSWHAPVSLVAL